MLVLVKDAWSSTSVQLAPVKYQFPDYRPRPGGVYDTWDANWLQIWAEIHTPDLSWSFTAPCLTTFEAAQLGAWLAEVSRGTVQPSDDTFGQLGCMPFVEPNVSVRLAATDGDLLTLVWHFSQESSPPNATEEIRYGAGYPVRIVISRADLLQALDEWHADLARFPHRDAQ